MSPVPEMPPRRQSDFGRVFPSGVRVGKTSYGLGVFAFAFIPAGTPIARVSGRIVQDANYGSDYCIDAGEGKVLEPGPPFCYLNHSCEPNCQLMQYVREGDTENPESMEVGELTENDMDFDDEETEETDEECFFGDGNVEELEYESDGTEEGEGSEEFADDDPVFEDDVDAEIWVEAMHDIMPGEELTIDYAWPADRAAKCLCGKPTCRGWIVDPAELDQLQNS